MDSPSTVVNAVAFNPLVKAIFQDRSPFKGEALNRILNQNPIVKLLIRSQGNLEIELDREGVLELLELQSNIAENKDLIFKNG